MVATPARGFLGRASERGALDRLLANVRGGQSGVLVICGEAGIGKTALVRHAAERAAGFRVAQIAGVEAEMELPFAGVHQLCALMLDRLDALPEPQRSALSVALGVAPGYTPDRFLVGLAVLSLLSTVAEERPLLCVVDDAHWLDGASGQVLGFVARRLLAESVAMVFAVPDPGARPELAGLAELPLAGLDEDDARALLARAIPGRLDDRVRDRIVAETRGNPLALLELPRSMSAADLAGGFDFPADELPGRLEDRYLRQVEVLPEATRRLMLVAAADPVGDAPLVWRAAQRLGIHTSALAPATSSGLLEIDDQVSFRHPLVRSAIYQSAAPAERRRVHHALADVTDPAADADRRAWHRALAAEGPDEGIAAELQRSAARAQTRGGLAAAAAFLERAAELTPDPAGRAGRALAAAEVKHQSGARQTALRLLAQAEAGPLDDLERARLHLVRGQTAFGSSHGGDAPPLLLAAARELEPLDPVLARDTYLEALSAALFVGRLAGEVGVMEVAEAARAAPAHTGRPQDLLLDGFALLITEGYAAGAPLLQRAVRAFRTEDLAPADAIRWLWLATHAAHDLWDDAGWEALCGRHLALARQAGALTVLPLVLSARIGLHLFAGELATAVTLNDETVAIAEATANGLPPYGTVAVAAFRGREADAAALIDAARAEVGPRGEGMGLTLLEHAAAVLYTGLGRYGEACEAAQRGAANPQELAFSTWSLPYLAEAAVRSDRPGLAAEALEQLARSTGPSGTDWALGVEARTRALVTDGGDAEAFYRDAIDRLARTRVRAEHARAHLLYGEWLRRQGRRADSRAQLRTAHEMFTAMGMEAFAERARRELLATGETVRKRRAERRDDLTVQERQIAGLARNGLSNPEIGARLFLSPRTVEWHLRNVFAKLGIRSRKELADALPRASELASA
jgi:DNA-binding CsgD family transcriptional regulator/tetratricopeptide (TPR) repeat protein